MIYHLQSEYTITQTKKEPQILIKDAYIAEYLD